MSSYIGKRILGQNTRSAKYPRHQVANHNSPNPAFKGKQFTPQYHKKFPEVIDPVTSKTNRVPPESEINAVMSETKGQELSANSALYPDFKDCKCKFGKFSKICLEGFSSYILGLSDKIAHFQPIKMKHRGFFNSILDSHKSFQVTHAKSTTDQKLPHDTSNLSSKYFSEIPSPPISHAGGSVDIDIHKVEVLGAASAAQKASATVPDQEHPEKYLNLDSDTLEEIV